MGSRKTVLVTGATGMAGLDLCRELTKNRDLEVRAGLHSPHKANLLPEGVTAVRFDTDAPETVDAALAGIDRLFLATPGGPFGPITTRVIVDAISRRPPLERIVKLSSLTPEKPPQAPTDLWALETEGMVRQLGVQRYFLRPPWFNQNFTNGYFSAMISARLLAFPFGQGRAGWVDTRDLAAIAAAALTAEEDAEETIYTPTGPELITLAEIAGHLSQATGYEIGYRALEDDEWIATMVGTGNPMEVAQATLALISKTRDGHAEVVTDDVERITGRPPHSFAEFAADHAEALRNHAETPPPQLPG